MFPLILTFDLLPNPATKGFSGKRALISFKHSILNFSGFFSITSLAKGIDAQCEAKAGSIF